MNDQSSSDDYIYSINGINTGANQSPLGQSSVFEENERRSAEKKRSRSGSTQSERYENSPEATTEEARYPIRSRLGKKSGQSVKYRSLLDSENGDTLGTVETLPPSQAGSSFWTSTEKEAFFSAVALTGPDNLAGISDRVITKSEAEVKFYLLLLQQHPTIRRPGAAHPDDFPLDGVPAAFELGFKCEAAVDLAAEALAQHDQRYDIELEKKRFGDLWLIDENVAVNFEAHMEQTQRASQFENKKSPGRINQAMVDSSSDRECSQSQDRGHRENSKAASPSAESGTSSQTGLSVGTLAAELLRPDSFLRLSRSLFMNSASDMTANWRTLGNIDCASSSPAIFRSAFDDFLGIAVNLTQRVVQASHFQATSRLRAKDDSHPNEEVTEIDVSTAIDILGLDLDWKRYWATVARRCGVEVYSESSRFQDGRPGTKNGVQLTFKEVEAELGLGRGRPPSSNPSDANDSIDGESIRDWAESGGDAAGSEADSVSNISQNHKSIDDGGESERERSTSYETIGKRQRSPDPCSDESEDDSYLDLLDQQAGQVEERRLMTLLDSKATSLSNLENRHGSRAAVARVPKQSRRKRIKQDLDTSNGGEPVRVSDSRHKSRIGMSTNHEGSQSSSLGTNLNKLSSSEDNEHADMASEDNSGGSSDGTIATSEATSDEETTDDG